ncbi:hypothetical protein [Streptomyces sp. NBC_01422]|uniref:hypothetical protein n=1 Tax=Streptomyces sp. NBC_01422 TaxID=2903859 RepID=UPI002E27AA32|nr:hypothetical protein [Streptomyces sp. NBC_01422]
MLGDDTTERRLRLLQAEFTQHQRRGPGDGRTATQVEAPAPIDLGTLDYMTAAVTEVVQHTHAAAPDAGPYRGSVEQVYDWAREHTAGLDEHRQQARETLIYRQGLEHALAMGDTLVVRKHPCPQCGCYGLYWRPETGKAGCVNHYCVDDDGVSHSWTLQHLAHQHIASKSALSARAT